MGWAVWTVFYSAQKLFRSRRTAADCEIEKDKHLPYDVSASLVERLVRRRSQARGMAVTAVVRSAGLRLAENYAKAQPRRPSPRSRDRNDL